MPGPRAPPAGSPGLLPRPLLFGRIRSNLKDAEGTAYMPPPMAAFQTAGW